MTERLRAAAQALVNRWDSPQWGGSAENLRHTGEYIAELRAALAEQPAEQTFAEYIETACALIKAADDAAADGDYMLDSDDCIKVLRGQWGAPLANDHPPKPQPAKHPFLVRDIAELIGSTVPDVCNALEDMGIEPRRSTNAAVTPDEALAVARRLAQPAKRVPLTDDDIDVLWAKQQTKPFKTHAEDRMAFARAIIAAYDAKNGITGEAK